MSMPSDAKTLWQSFVKKGMSDRDALFAVMDHLAQLGHYDRNRYDERLKRLESQGEGLDQASETA